jgi:hypothetical protein
MSDREDSDVGAIENEIGRYLLAHPGAADTAEGIRRWWLPESLAEKPAGRIREALDRLVERRTLVRVGLPDGRTLYAAPDRGAGSGPQAS